MESALVCLVVLFGIVVDINVQGSLSRPMKQVTNDTKFNQLPVDMQNYVKNIFEAKKKLDTVKGENVMSRYQRCRYKFEIDKNSLLYLLKRWSSGKVFIPTKTGKVIVDMSRDWYMMPTTHLVFMYDCIFSPSKLVQDTVTIK